MSIMIRILLECRVKHRLCDCGAKLLFVAERFKPKGDGDAESDAKWYAIYLEKI